MEKLMRGCLLAVGVLFALAAAPLQAAEPMMLKQGVWVCDSPESYALAGNNAAREASHADHAKRNAVLGENRCLYVDDDIIEDLLPPFVTVVERNGALVKVTFFVEYYKKISFLHRKIRHVRYVGWTGAENVESYF